MQKFQCAILPIVMAFFCLGACGRRQNDIVAKQIPVDAWTVKIDWLTGPIASTEAINHARLSFFVGKDVSEEIRQMPTSVSVASVFPFMPIHGHGSGDVQPIVAAVADQVNVFDVSNIAFIMPGPWELQITATVNGHSEVAKPAVDVREESN